MKRNDDIKNRCPLRGQYNFLIKKLKNFGMWLIRKIKNSIAFFGAVALFVSASTLVGTESAVPVPESRVISKTTDVVMVGSTPTEVAKATPEVEETKTLKSNEEIANEVISGLWGNGDDRRQRLLDAGYDPDAIQKIVESKIPKLTKEKVTVAKTANNGGAVLTKSGGVCYNNPYGYKETWYSQKVLPGGGLKIPGRHVDDRGLVCDIDGYICVAINVNDKRFPYGSMIQTSLGMAKVYDHGCAPGVIDVYVNW